MGNIQCVKCGMDAFGKCPKCRTVFPEKEFGPFTEIEKSCEHNFHFVQAEEKCIYGCNYTSKYVYAGQ